MTSLKNLMVHLDQGERTSARLALAVSLARQHQARLLGVFGQRAPAAPVGRVSHWPSSEYAQARDASREMFAKATVGLPQADWHDINRGTDAEVLHQITELARHADLVILGQHDERFPDYPSKDLVREVILECGRPVLVIPYAGDFTEVGKHPLIAWNNDREAARTLGDCLPLIAGCDEAMVISFTTHIEESSTCCSEVARHLETHGIKARTEMMLVQDFRIMDTLLNRACDWSADLVVMGAHGQIGFPFVSRGAGTRYILQHMTVPLLMSH